MFKKLLKLGLKSTFAAFIISNFLFTAYAADTQNLDYLTEAKHTHTFYSDIKDNSKSKQGFYVIDRFQIEFVQNTISNVDTTTLQCSNSTNQACHNGFSSLYGTTTINSSKSGDKYIITWNFAANGGDPLLNDFNGRPMIPGSSAPADKRMFEEFIEFYAKKDIQENGKVITDAKILLKEAICENGDIHKCESASGYYWYDKVPEGTTIFHRPDPQIVKSSPTAMDVIPGQKIIYEIKISNNGPWSSLKAPYSIVDELSQYHDINTVRQINNGGAAIKINKSANTITWTFNQDLGPKQSRLVTFGIKTKDIPAGAQVLVKNLATFKNPVKDVKDETTHRLEKPTTTMNIVKTADPVSGSTIPAGSKITYTLEYTNTGDVTATEIWVYDNFQADAFSNLYSPGSQRVGNNFTWLTAYLAPGQSIKQTIYATTKSDLPADFVIKNTASVESNESKRKESEPTIHIIESKVKKSNLKIEKFSNPPSGSTIAAGSEIHYKLVVKNIGNANATNVKVYDILDPKYFSTIFTDEDDIQNNRYVWNIGTLTPNQEHTVFITAVTRDDLTPEQSPIINFALTNSNEEPNLKRSDNTLHFIKGKIEPPIDLKINKIAIPASGTEIFAGDEITYYLSYENADTKRTATNVIIADQFYSKYFDTVNSTADDIKGEIHYWHLRSLAPGQKGVLEVKTKTRANLIPGKDVVINQAFIKSDQNTTPIGSNITEHPIKARPFLEIIKTANPPSGSAISAGDEITYFLYYKNLSTTLTATEVSITDNFESQYFSSVQSTADDIEGHTHTWNIGAIAPGQSGQFTIKTKTRATLVPNQDIVKNHAILKAKELKDPITSNETQHPVKSAIKPNVEIIKTSTSPLPNTLIEAGTLINYKINFKNTGDITLNSIYLTDTLEENKFQLNTVNPGHALIHNQNIRVIGKFDPQTRIITWNLNYDLKPGESGEAIFSVNTLNTLNAGTIVENVAIFHSKNPELNKPSNPVKHIIAEENFIALINKSANPLPNTVLAPGVSIEYIIDFKNVSSDQLKNIKIEDILDDPEYLLPPANISGNGQFNANTKTITWQIGTLNPNQTGQVKFTVNTDPNIKNETQIENQARLASERVIIDSNQVVHSINPDLGNQIKLVKSANPASGTNIAAGTTINYSIEFENQSQTPLANVKISDKLQENIFDLSTLNPGFAQIEGTNTRINGVFDAASNTINWTFDPNFIFNPGQKGTASFSATTLETLTEDTTIKNTARLSSKQIIKDSNTTIHTIKKPSTIVSVEKTANPASESEINAGDTITYFIKVKNNSNNPLLNSVIKDLLEDPEFLGNPFDISDNGIYDTNTKTITWNLGTLAKNSTKTVSFKIKTDPKITQAAIIDNFARFTADKIIIDSTEVIHYLNLRKLAELAKTASPASGSIIQSGDLINYTLHYQNLSQTTLTNAILTDNLDTNLDLSTLQIENSGALDPIRRRITWNLGTIKPNESGAVTFRIRSLQNLPNGTNILNKGELRANSELGGIIIHSNYTIHTIQTISALTGSKSSIPVSGSEINVGAQIDYTINFQYNGDTPLTNLQIIDPLDKNKFNLNSLTTREARIFDKNNNLTQIAEVRFDQTTETITWSFPKPIQKGDHGTAEFLINTLNSLPDRTIILNQARFKSTELPDVFTNTTIHIIKKDIQPEFFLNASKNASPIPNSIVKEGDKITYFINFENLGTNPLTKIKITDILEENKFDLDSVIINQAFIYNFTDLTTPLQTAAGNFNKNTRALTWEFANPVQPGQEGIASFSINLNSNLLPNITSVSNTAEVSTKEVLKHTNTVTHYLIAPDAFAEIFKDSNPDPNTGVAPGDAITYFLIFKNTSNTDLHNVIIEDTLKPEDFNINSAVPAAINNTLIWNIGDLKINEEKSVTFTVNTRSDLKPFENQVENFFTFRAQNGKDIIIDSNTVYHPIILPGAISITKSANPISGERVNQGQNIDYTLTFTNNSQFTFTNPSITDAIDPNLIVTDQTINQNGDYNEQTRVITWNLGEKLIPGQTGTVTFTAQANPAAINGTTVINKATLHTTEMTVPSNETIHTIGKEIPGGPSCNLTVNPGIVDKDNLPATFTTNVTLTNPPVEHGNDPKGELVFWSATQGSLSQTSGFTTTYSGGVKGDKLNAKYTYTHPTDPNLSFTCPGSASITDDGGTDGGGMTCQLQNINPNSVKVSGLGNFEKEFDAFEIALNRTFTWINNVENSQYYFEKEKVGQDNQYTSLGTKANPVTLTGQIPPNTDTPKRFLRIIDETYEKYHGGQKLCRQTAIIERETGGGPGGGCIVPDIIPVTDNPNHNPQNGVYVFKLVYPGNPSKEIKSGDYIWTSSDPAGTFKRLEDATGQQTLTTRTIHQVIFTKGALSNLPISIRAQDRGCADVYNITKDGDGTGGQCTGGISYKITPFKDASLEDQFYFEDVKIIEAYTPNWNNGKLNWNLSPENLGELLDLSPYPEDSVLPFRYGDFLTTSRPAVPKEIYFLRQLLDEKGSLTIQSSDNSPFCKLTLEISDIIKELNEKLEKTVTPTVITENGQIVTYTIAYTPNNTAFTSVKIKDEIGIQGFIAEDRNQGGRIIPNIGKKSIIKIFEGENEISTLRNENNNIISCETNPNQTCLDPNQNDIFTSEGVIINNLKSNQTIKIIYKTIASAQLDCSDNTNQNFCGKSFTNTAIRVIRINEMDQDSSLSDDATVWAICPYVLTRNTGDVFFEKEFEFGADVSCLDPNVRNTTGLAVIKEPETPKIIDKTGPTDWVHLTVSLCDNKLIPQRNQIDNNQVISRFSSFICELSTDISEIWEKEFVEKRMEFNKQFMLKAHSGLSNSITIRSFEDSILSNYTQPNPNQKIFRIEGDLNIKSADINTANNLYVREPMTFIINNGNLNIYDNIYYDTALNPGLMEDHSKIPSIAFVVTNGKIAIHKEVTHLAGVYFTKKTDKQGSGQFVSLNNEESTVKTPLIIKGSAYGDLQPLFKKRPYTGDPRQDKGSIVIKYDERVMLNTPPGLNEFMDLSWEKVAR